MATDLVMKLMPLLKNGHSVTDNYLTFLDPCLRLAKQGCSLVGKILSNQSELPNNLEEPCSLHDTTIFNFADAAVATITIPKYKCKKSKSVNILSSLHSNVAIPSKNILKNKLETLLFLQRKLDEVDIFDQMSRDATL